MADREIRVVDLAKYSTAALLLRRGGGFYLRHDCGFLRLRVVFNFSVSEGESTEGKGGFVTVSYYRCCVAHLWTESSAHNWTDRKSLGFLNSSIYNLTNYGQVLSNELAAQHTYEQ